ncbi:hypothetical protein Q3G72_016074 [Acer saccharum]|nr:hypothetical protein Q3G72_007041 [Acer saccharum]KAK1548559.1 hypothetical protein Q3G72_016074 [Acer saccharum]
MENTSLHAASVLSLRRLSCRFSRASRNARCHLFERVRYIAQGCSGGAQASASASLEAFADVEGCGGDANPGNQSWVAGGFGERASQHASDADAVNNDGLTPGIVTICAGPPAHMLPPADTPQSVVLVGSHTIRMVAPAGVYGKGTDAPVLLTGIKPYDSATLATLPIWYWSSTGG